MFTKIHILLSKNLLSIFFSLFEVDFFSFETSSYPGCPGIPCVAKAGPELTILHLQPLKCYHAHNSLVEIAFIGSLAFLTCFIGEREKENMILHAYNPRLKEAEAEVSGWSELYREEGMGGGK